MLAAGVPTVSRSFHVLEPSATAFRERNCAQESSNIRQSITNDMNSCLARAQRVSCLKFPVRKGRYTESGMVRSRIADISRYQNQSWVVDTISTSRRDSSLLCGHVDRLRSPDTHRIFSSPAIKINRSKREVPVTEDIDEDSEDVCHVGCVREISTKQELEHALEAAQRRKAVVVVDFFKTACGSCKYIEHGFAKLCRGEAEKQHPVVFLKHNVSVFCNQSYNVEMITRELLVGCT